MTPAATTLLAADDLSAFGKDPWWLILIKAVAIVVLLVLFTLFNIWFERRVVAKMQHRLGPNVHGPFGLLQSLADGIKLSLKEGFIPKQADKLVFLLAPFLAVTMACTAFAVIPFGPEVSIFGTRTPLQVADLPVGVLFVLAVASIGIYGIVLAGWSSGSTYPLLGGLRSSAQMISYEVAMALSFVAVFLYSGSMSTSQIVESQASGGTAVIGGVTLQLPSWYAVVLLPSFIIYMISMVGETNRAPFDLPEAEGELVAGFGTEYSSMNYAAFYLAEYINMVTVSAVATTLFLGGWRAPWPISIWEGANEGWLPVVWFFGKLLCLLFVFIWLRGTLPRMRYDQFMKLGWKWLIPIALVWTLFVATARAMLNAQMQRQFFFAIAAIVVVVLLGSIVYDNIAAKREEKEKAEDDAGKGTEFDAFAGGYPVPPMPGQELPDWREPAPLATATATAKSSEASSEPDSNSQEESRG